MLRKKFAILREIVHREGTKHELECHASLFRMILRIIKIGRENAELLSFREYAKGSLIISLIG